MGSWPARRIPVSAPVRGDWTAPRTLLAVRSERPGLQVGEQPLAWSDLAEGMIPVQEQNTGMRYRAPEMFRIQDQDDTSLRGPSHVTGAHAIRVGGSNRSGNLGQLGMRPYPPSAIACGAVCPIGLPSALSAPGEPTSVPIWACSSRSLDAEQDDPDLRAAIRLLQQQLPRAAHRSYDAGADAEHHVPGATRAGRCTICRRDWAPSTTCSATARPRSRRASTGTCWRWGRTSASSSSPTRRATW